MRMMISKYIYSKYSIDVICKEVWLCYEKMLQLASYTQQIFSIY